MKNSSSKESLQQKENRLKRSNDKIATAMPLTFGFFLVISLIVWSQQFLSEAEQRPSTIKVASDGSERQEVVEVSINLGELSEQMKSQIERMEADYTSGQLNIQQLRERLTKEKNSDNNDRSKLVATLIVHLIKEKNFSKVLPLFELLSPQMIERYRLGFYHALSLSKTNAMDDAIVEYQNFLTNEPFHQSALINLGLLLLQKHRNQEAFQLFTKGLTFASGRHKAKIYAGLGDSQLALKKISSAIASYQKSIEYRPTSSLTWRKLARAQKEQSLSFKVINSSFQKAVSLEPSNTRLTNEFSTFLFEKMRFEETIDILRKHLRQSKTSIAERTLLIISYIEKQRIANAKKQIGYLKKYASRRQQKDIVASLSSYIQGQYKNSLDGFKASLKKKRNNNLAYYMIGLSYLKLNKPKNASIYLSKVTEDSYFYNTAQYRLTISLILQGNTVKAKAIIGSLLSRLPNKTEVAYQVAKLAYEERDSDIALTAINNAINLSPEKKQYQFLLAKIKWRMGKKEQSIALLRSILEEHKKYKPAIYRLADYYEQLNQNSDSMENFSRLLAIDSDYSNAQYRLAVLLVQDKQDLNKSLALLKNYLQRRGADVRARLYYAKVLCEDNKIEACKEQLQIVQKFDPKNGKVKDFEIQYFTAN